MDKLIDRFIDRVIEILLERATQRLEALEPQEIVTKYGKKAEDFFAKLIDKVF